MMKRLLFVGVAVTVASCGGSSPIAPSTPVTPTPSTYTLSGTLNATNGGQPLTGSIDINGRPAQAADGAFSLILPSTMAGALAVNISGGGLIPRRVYVNGGTSRSVSVDAIADGNGFDLNFYREFVRDATESPSLQPLRRWTTPVSVYVRTPNFDARTLDMIERVSREMIPAWTAGTLSVATIERGTDSRENQAGWLTIQAGDQTDHCGFSDIAKSGGTVNLYPRRPTCACGGYQIAPAIIRHEIGHAMGFYHTDSPNDVMNARTVSCEQPASPRELYHAAIAYHRPIGNQDPDLDPSGAVTLAPMRVP